MQNDVSNPCISSEEFFPHSHVTATISVCLESSVFNVWQEVSAAGLKVLKMVSGMAMDMDCCFLELQYLQLKKLANSTVKSYFIGKFRRRLGEREVFKGILGRKHSFLTDL